MGSLLLTSCATQNYWTPIHWDIQLPWLHTALAIYCRKHDLSPYHIDTINFDALHNFFKSKWVYTRASYSKLIHDWIPTYAYLCRQVREQSPLCPWCNAPGVKMQLKPRLIFSHTRTQWPSLVAMACYMLSSNLYQITIFLSTFSPF